MISTFISLSKPTKKPRRQSHVKGNSRLQGKGQGASSKLLILQTEDDEYIKKKKKWTLFKTLRNSKYLWMSPKAADCNRTDKNSLTCDDLCRVYIFHKLSSQHSTCMSWSDVRKLERPQFICNFMFVPYIIMVTPKHHCRYVGFLSSTLQGTVLVACRQRKMRSSSFCRSSVHIADKQITGSLHLPLLGFSILKLFGCSSSLTGTSPFLNSSYESMKHTLRSHQSSRINRAICITVNLMLHFQSLYPLNCTYWWNTKSSKRVFQPKPICKVVGFLSKTLKKLKWLAYN